MKTLLTPLILFALAMLALTCWLMTDATAREIKAEFHANWRRFLSS